MYVSDVFIPSHPEICDSVEHSTTCLNVSCCFIAIKHAVLSIYRSPNTCCRTAIDELHSILVQFSTYVKYFIVAGNFNIELKVYWNIKICWMTFCLTQHIDSPSRIGTNSATLIHHISGSNHLSVVRSHQAVGLSDHFIQCVDFEAPACSQEARTIWIHSFLKCDWDKLRETLHYAPWHVVSTFDDIDDRWEMFQSIL